MTTTITVSLPDEQVAAATRAVDGGRADSVSAYVSAALAASAKADQGKPEQRRGEPLADILAGWDAEAGPLSPEDDAWARRALGLGSPVLALDTGALSAVEHPRRTVAVSTSRRTP